MLLLANLLAATTLALALNGATPSSPRPLSSRLQWCVAIAHAAKLDSLRARAAQLLLVLLVPIFSAAPVAGEP